MNILSEIGFKSNMRRIDFSEPNNPLNTTDFLQGQKSKYEKNNTSVLNRTVDEMAMQYDCKNPIKYFI
jgi:hypothetical protein